MGAGLAEPRDHGGTRVAATRTFSPADLVALNGRYTPALARTICEGFVASGVLERRGERVYGLTREGRRLCLDVALATPVEGDGA